MPTSDAPTPELLYLLSGDEDDFLEASQNMQPADIAEALSQLPPEGAAQVVRALPFHLAVQVFDEPELTDRAGIVTHLPNEVLGPIISAMSSDQQVGLIRELGDPDRERLGHLIDAPTRDLLRQLLNYPPTSAGGIMTTEFLSVPGSWTALQVRKFITEVGSAKETVYAIYVVDEKDQRLQHVISLREVIMVASETPVLEIGERRKPVTTRPLIDREEVARLISKYNLLAIPVVNEGGQILGIVTVDDIIDTLISETTEDVQKFGGMEALDEPYMEIGLGKMIQKRAGWLCALFLGEMLTATAMGHFEHEISKAVVLALFIPLIISSGGNSGSQAT
ncbi:MAG TPA: magnesium transporter, partial [Gemmatimonadales bacterium]|nr:magnesium transporter [Gemmatimonadales bacterium]